MATHAGICLVNGSREHRAVNEEQNGLPGGVGCLEGFVRMTFKAVAIRKSATRGQLQREAKCGCKQDTIDADSHIHSLREKPQRRFTSVGKSSSFIARLKESSRLAA
jgi:hypothetical protein